MSLRKYGTGEIIDTEQPTPQRRDPDDEREQGSAEDLDEDSDRDR